MSKTTRHQNFWEMRQLEKRLVSRFGSPAYWPDPGAEGSATAFDRMSSKYGYKSMVYDRRRRVSTRNANSEWVRELRRGARRAAAQRLLLESKLDDLDGALWPVGLRERVWFHR
jgi:hypothetical protein